MSNSAQNSHTEKTDDQAKTEAAQEENGQARSRRSRTVSNFIIAIALFAAAIFLGIAVNYHTKGGYSSVKLALFWGILGYALAGVGTYFAYYEYVIKPARAAERAKIADEDRGWIAFNGITTENLAVGREYILYAVFRYRGTKPATIKRTRLSVKFLKTRVPAPDIFKPEDISDELPPPYRLPVESIADQGNLALPIYGGPFTEELQNDLKQKIVFWQIVGSVEYESGGVLRYTTFCAVYEPEMGGRFGSCGGTMN